MYVCQRKLSFWVWDGWACLISKLGEMKPKTQEKLTKHTNPRWLMGPGEMTSWPVSETIPVWCGLSPANTHLLDITPRNVYFSSICNRWVVLWQRRMRPVMSLNDTFPCVFLRSIGAALKTAVHQCGDDVRPAKTTCSLLRDAALMSAAVRMRNYAQRIF